MMFTVMHRTVMLTVMMAVLSQYRLHLCTKHYCTQVFTEMHRTLMYTMHTIMHISVHITL